MDDTVGLQTRRLLVTRYESGAWVNGRFEKGDPKVVSFYASVQPVSGQELLQLPEGHRTRNVVKAYACDNAFRVPNTNTLEPGDSVEIDAIPFVVLNVFRWTLPGSTLSHWKAVLAQRGDDGESLT